MRAIILAAGRGSRLKSFFNKPKCLIKLGYSNRTLLERTYENLMNQRLMTYTSSPAINHLKLKNL